MESSAIRAYEIFRKRFSSEEAETIVAWKDEHLAKWVASKDDVYAVKEDIAALDMKIASVRVEIAKAQSSTNRWLIVTAIALFGALSGVIIAVARGMLK